VRIKGLQSKERPLENNQEDEKSTIENNPPSDHTTCMRGRCNLNIAFTSFNIL
jgi:hypothetical protein